MLWTPTTLNVREELPFYPIERMNMATGEMFGDGEHILYVNGAYRGNTSDIATFDVYADGQLVKANATDFYKKFPVGTLIEVRNINVADGYTYIGTSDKASYGNVHHQDELPFYVETELVNDVALSFVDSSSLE
mgnify:CR=1 FL=1